MQEDYFEGIFIPNRYLEVFANFILEKTQEAIEERDFFFSATAKVGTRRARSSGLENVWLQDLKLEYCHIQHLPTFQENIQNFAQNTPENLESAFLKAFVIYSKFDPNDTLLLALSKFCLELSDRAGKKVGFAYQIQKYKNQDWIQKYQQSVQPINCGKFYIHPSWHKNFTNKKDVQSRQKIDLLIDPGLAFGSGHHASTAMCLEFLSNILLKGKVMLDVGCGSGILSLAGKKLGAEVEMCDSDLLAINESKKNFTLNNLEPDKIWQGSINHIDKKYDVVVVNILADIIKALQPDLSNALKPNSILVLSGILEEHQTSVLKRFNDFRLLSVLYVDGWVGLKLTQK